MTTTEDDRYRQAPPAAVNGRDWTSLRAWSQAIGIIGIPGAIAIFLVYIGATELPRIARLQEQLVLEARQSREETAKLVELTNLLIRSSQRTCFNAAKDANGRDRCFEK